MGALRDFQRDLERESDELFGDRWRKGSQLYWATALAGEVGEVCIFFVLQPGKEGGENLVARKRETVKARAASRDEAKVKH